MRTRQPVMLRSSTRQEIDTPRSTMIAGMVQEALGAERISPRTVGLWRMWSTRGHAGGNFRQSGNCLTIVSCPCLNGR